MVLLTNLADQRHCHTISDLLSKSEEAWLFTAYFKKSGLKLIADALRQAIGRGIKVEMYCGLSQSLSHPDALREVQDLFTKSVCELRLIDLQGCTFHPKLYCFFLKNSDLVEIVVGSANLSGQGLGGDDHVCNFEASVQLSVSRQHPIVEQVRMLRGAARRSKQTDLNSYRARWEIFDAERRKAEKRANEKLPTLKDTADLDKYLSNFNNDNEARESRERREKDLIAAREVIEELCNSTSISQGRFLQLYSQLVGAEGSSKQRFWHSGGLSRHKKQVARQYLEFINLARRVRQGRDLDAGALFDKAQEFMIKGAGVNVITELMNTVDPKRFAVLNEKTLGALRHIRTYKEKLSFHNRTSGSLKAHEYAEFNAIAEELRDKYHLTTMSEVDNFLVFVDRKKKEEAKPRKPHNGN